MTHYKYIVLTDSAATKTKRFRVMWEGFKPTLDKAQSVNRAVNGGLDVSMGGIYEGYEMVIRVRHTEADSNYGTLADLEYFYRLNDPTPTSGSPSNLITMTDHFGTTKYVYMLGQFPRLLMGCEIEGTEAWYMVPVQIQVT